MTKKVNLAPFKLRTRKGFIWIENSETGTKGPELEASTQTRKAMRQRVARLNTEIAMSRLGI
ncbi:MAG: hypothetical protein VX079_02900 [Pseudomonadota bacterium]|jgi:hypothetical protein|nr:hypothetical protein [Pseudomonadota bacterium]MEC8203707.1 hypothetical protein [Pseudomonadota bacterium]|tara:strand:- start:31 stop:216 length:186 start_codon:yes stop_codon:yes gene_type:complete